MSSSAKTKTRVVVTNADLADSIEGLRLDLGKRLDKLETTVKTTGLNGHSQLLKDFLDDQAVKKKSRDAQAIVWADIGRRFSWLRRPRDVVTNFFKLIVAALISAVAWAVIYGKITIPIHFH